MNRKAPIGIFCYNRPQHLKVTLEALKRCPEYSEHPLYIYCDAPQGEKDLLLCEATRAVAKIWVKLYGGEVIERESNHHFRNITEGISELCDKHGEVIVVEDDIIVSPDFLKYMQESLDRYRDEDQVYGISAYMYPDSQPPKPETFFLSFAFIWGWATWQRAWKNYSWTPDGWERILSDTAYRQRFNFDDSMNYAHMLEKAVKEAYTWDIQWSFTLYRDNALMLTPCRSLIYNTGIGCGVHGKRFKEPSMEGRDLLAHGHETIDDFASSRLSPKIEFPPKIQPNEQAYLNVAKAFRHGKKKKKGWIKRNGQNLINIFRGKKRSVR